MAPAHHPDVLEAARDLRRVTTLHLAVWGVALVVLVGAAIGSASPPIRTALARARDGVDDKLLLALLLLASPLPSALLTTFAQHLRRAIHPQGLRSAEAIAAGSVLAPFIVPAVVFAQLDRALTELQPPVSRTRGALLALSPLSFVVLGVFFTSWFGRYADEVMLGLFCASRLAWGLLTRRACDSVLGGTALERVRAHGDAPVAGG